MHRKIKSKNRKKLKPVDPFNINASKEDHRQRNLPPNDDEQEIPRSFKKIFMEPANSPKKVKRKRDPNMIEGYKRKSWETDKQFLNRVQRNTYDFVNDQLTKIKFGLVGVEPSDVLGKEKKKKRMGSAQDASNDEGPSKKKRKRKADNGKSILSDQDDLLVSKASRRMESEKKVERKRQKKRKVKDDVDPLYMREIVPFGDRVDEPPQLTALPKKAKGVQSSKAGARDLLLKRQFQAHSAPDMDRNRRYENDRTIKCADLAKQRILEEERRRVIEAYRTQKKRAVVKEKLNNNAN